MQRIIIFCLLLFLLITSASGDSLQNIDELMQHGIALAEQGRYEQAAAAFDIVTQHDPDYVDAWRKKAYSFLSAGHYRDAILAYDTALSLNPDDVGSLVDAGVALNSLFQYEDAISMFDAALAIDPDNMAALNNKALSLTILGRCDEALPLYSHALEKTHDCPHTLNNLGLTLSSMGKVNESLAVFDTIIRKFPTYTEAWNNKGLDFLARGQYDEANEMFDMATRLQPDDPIYWNNKGTALFKAGAAEDARLAYLMSVSLHTRSSHRASSAGSNGNDTSTQILADIVNLSSFDATSADSWNEIGSLFLSHNAYAEADAAYERALQLDPTSGLAHEYFSNLQDADVAGDHFVPIPPDEETSCFNALATDQAGGLTGEQEVTGTVKYLVEQQGWKITLPGTISGVVSAQTGKMEITSTDAFISYGGTKYPIEMNIEGSFSNPVDGEE